jgi:GR25 family glycosyltransferase involved in LPS biosynthesis
MEGDIKIFCINLKHRTDRYNRFLQQPEVQKLISQYPFERFEGINGSKLDIQKDDRISLRTKRNIKEHTRRDHEELDSAGGVGCYLSHTAVWQKIVDAPEPYALIFEDDAMIPLGFTEKLKAAMRDTTLLPQQPDVWFLSSPSLWYYSNKGKPPPDSVKEQVVGPWIMKSCASFTGYLISKEGARRLLETAFPIDMHVDLYSCLAGDMGRILTVYHRNVSIRPYSLTADDSDIQMNRDCVVCNVPARYDSRGYVLVNLPLFFIGSAVAFYLYTLGRGALRRR